MHHDTLISLMSFQQQVRIFHWQTTKFSRHKAYDEVYESLDGFIDEIAEICMGKYGRIEVPDGCSIELKNMSDVSLNDFLNDFCDFLIGLADVFDPKKDSDVLNIRDEILGQINKLKYLLTLS